MFQKTLTFDDLSLTEEAVFRQMGYGQAPGDRATRAELQAVLAEVSRCLRPQFCYHVVRGRLSAHALEADGVRLSVGPVIARQLRGSEAFALFVCTAGTAFHAYQQQLSARGDLVKAFLADAVGSVVAECCADRMEEALQASVDKLGWRRTNRYSPGYCGWSVAEQRDLFGLLGPGAPCGVRLTGGALMVPVKSVSGVLGLGAHVQRRDYTCGLCEMKHCFMRRSKH